MRNVRRSLPVPVLATALLLTSCTGSGGGPAAAGPPRIAVDIPRSDSDFWNSFGARLAEDRGGPDTELLPVTFSDGDVHRLVDHLGEFRRAGARAVVVAPQDTRAAAADLDRLTAAGIGVISVDTRPEAGSVYMVVRADNRAHGTRACEFLGGRLGGRGSLVVLQDSLDSVNSYERSQAFGRCLQTSYPGTTVHRVDTGGSPKKAAEGLAQLLATDPGLGGIYLQGGSVFLEPVLETLQARGRLVPAGRPGHLTVVSNDGTPAELAAIRSGLIDATVSQPVDLYAHYALVYARAAAAGQHFAPGPTDHGSTVVTLPNGLEDQLPATLVTRQNADDPTLWGNRRTR
ncbi:simple sugar transport system substrate-binding protein/ribose transport system substrate-binding protein [Streptomyces sp. TLI_053]|uniref:sugar ABC transporter substrate-binding protein n=1 Tax=Streptomyces sp. TLI_053 TaxID=1855352 RepID=UPI00087B4EE5|nr:substrate-binding domain-containing protein [Streptomyces sp. TLI_053]SDT08336.1 simple sugar transport system substrate-binding protein/ribose transport system substrate-binding protein [Streptomyces sp. TLI_053]